jgi:basic membrane protein A
MGRLRNFRGPRFLAGIALLSSLSLATAFLGGPVASAASASSFKVGLVTDTGGLNDHGFNHLSYVGLEEAHQKLGVTVSVVQSQSQNDYVPNLSTYAREGYNVVIAVGFLMQQAVQQVAKQYPNTKFLIIDDSVPGKNIASALFNTQQCGYLVGMLAGLVQKQHALPHINKYNTLGVVGGQAIPPVTTYIAGFYAGVHAVDPSAHILLSYTNDFNNPNNGQSYAQAEIAKHADIIFQVAGGTGLGVITAAKQAHVYAIGVDANQGYLAPGTVITSALKGVNVATFDVINAAFHNRFRAGTIYFNLSGGGVGMAPPTKGIPASILKQVNLAKAKIMAGKIKPPTTIPKQ